MPVPHNRVAYSFIIDEGAHFGYQAWHLALSLIALCRAEPAQIHAQFTARSDRAVRQMFERAGFSTHTLVRFGDGKYCNKIGQFEALHDADFDVLVLLDTDTIAVDDLTIWLSPDVIMGKVVDDANPPLAVLDEIAERAGLNRRGDMHPTDNGAGQTYAGNFNGGMYAIPKTLCALVGHEWRNKAHWLLVNIEPLRRAKREMHVDQVSFWLALQSLRLPYQLAPANMNYFIHADSPHLYFDAKQPIALLHYHNVSMPTPNEISPQVALAPAAMRAVNIANSLIDKSPYPLRA